jgi:hypothetical protein
MNRFRRKNIGTSPLSGFSRPKSIWSNVD